MSFILLDWESDPLRGSDSLITTFSNITFDELCYLAADPDFAQVYPEQAAQMRQILQQMDSS